MAMQRTWAEAQAAFADALVDAGRPPPPGVIECGGAGQRGGFAVYRNNSMAALVDALEERFPVTSQLVGTEFFRAMAGAYAAENRPRTPVLLHYGDDFPAFIDAFAPADGVVYLSDVARLEVAWSQAYHASEARSLKSQVLVGIPPGELLLMRVTLHPSARILRSRFPVADIHAAHRDRLAVTPPARWQAQDVLVVRPDTAVHVHTLGPGVQTFLEGLLERRCLQDAAEKAAQGHADFDAGQSIVNVFGFGAVVALDDVATEET